MLKNHFIVNPSRFTSDSAPPFTVAVGVTTTAVGVTTIVGVATVAGVVTVLFVDVNRWVNGTNDVVVVMARTFPTLVQKPSSTEITE